MAKMAGSNWLPLVDYSNKYKVSISTLRRRIRGKSIQFKLDGGKYFIFDEPLARTSRGRRPIENTLPDFVEEDSTPSAPQNIALEQKTEPVISAANNLLEELKSAYSLVLHEKEEMISQLRAEITDLRTLVRVLEENQRR